MPVDVSAEVAARDVVAVADAAPLADTDTVADTDTDTVAVADTGEDIGASGPVGRRLRLDDGRVVEGELISIYDGALWQDPDDGGRLLGLFDPERFVDSYADRSIVFVDERAVVADEPVALPAGRLEYRDWLLSRGVALSAVPLASPAYVITGHEDHHLAEDGYGDFAWDLVLAEDDGVRWRGDGLDLEDYLSWGAPVTAPVAGEVVEVVRDADDIPPGALPPEGIDAVENLVGIRVAGLYTVYLLHLQQGSVPAEVAPGVTVAAGDAVGRVGNSGTTLEPHLHVVLLMWDAERERYWSVPAEFLDVWQSVRSTGAVRLDRYDPEQGDWIGSAPF
ncbi:MAG: hypothetical protein CVU56_22335 [Deltaproteobacteria bacterium HGW-Deltaproteobacteria-14]|nr:MAG: hypothetical protein CVU56_22335 [Deltaproteobacteria bacterium HGW-Deltaproteobacteria-14]